MCPKVSETWPIELLADAHYAVVDRKVQHRMTITIILEASKPILYIGRVLKKLFRRRSPLYSDGQHQHSTM